MKTTIAAAFALCALSSTAFAAPHPLGNVRTAKQQIGTALSVNGAEVTGNSKLSREVLGPATRLAPGSDVFVAKTKMATVFDPHAGATPKTIAAGTEIKIKASMQAGPAGKQLDYSFPTLVK
jgi:hypothetical protein